MATFSLKLQRTRAGREPKKINLALVREMVEGWKEDPEDGQTDGIIYRVRQGDKKEQGAGDTASSYKSYMKKHYNLDVGAVTQQVSKIADEATRNMIVEQFAKSGEEEGVPENMRDFNPLNGFVFSLQLATPDESDNQTATATDRTPEEQTDAAPDPDEENPEAVEENPEAV